MKPSNRRKHINRIKELIRNNGLFDMKIINGVYGLKMDLSSERIAPVNKGLKKWFYKKTNKSGKVILLMEFYPGKFKHKEKLLMTTLP